EKAGVRGPRDASSRRQRVPLLDCRQHALARLVASARALLFTARDRGELLVLDHVAEPARIIALLQVMVPRLEGEAGRDPRKDFEVLGADVQALLRPAEVEAPFGADVALGVLAPVAVVLQCRQRRHETYGSPARSPEEDLRIGERLLRHRRLLYPHRAS